ncbi:endolytic transglycosylase MltG [Apilactobacillus ozensis]|uniref:endolytic transglycosylase MltG n=1 Tax=Apilactobacillus ozensis TaxID=866801 RepID=UPI0007051A1D|nr:endolytic transglycosylase MltG [Apilactobacillus ozensis]
MNTDSNHSQKNNNNIGRKIFLSIVGILLVLGLCIFLVFHNYLKTSLKPLNSNDKSFKQIKIPMGASDKKIGSILQDNGIVKSGMVFDYYVNSHNLSKFGAGYYRLSPSMSLKKIADSLQKGGSAQPLEGTYGRVLVREGASIDQIASAVDKGSKYSAKDFINLMKDKKFIDYLVDKYPKLLKSINRGKDVKYPLEGFLYPATYNSSNDISLKSIVEQMVSKTNYEMSPYYKKISDSKLNVRKVLTIASIVEKEDFSYSNKRKIAGVLFNKIRMNMPLRSSTSIFYILNKNHLKLTNKDLKVKSPYNLYKHTGFGPGPFNNPSIESIKAVINPDYQDKMYLYYVANSSNGKVYYYEELNN